jgi:hypothetical protein
MSVVWGELGVANRVGLGDNAQHLLSQADIERKQAFYYNHAMAIINDLKSGEFPFGADI